MNIKPNITTKITDGIYKIGPFIRTKTSSNACYIIKDESEIILVNTGSAHDHTAIKDELETIIGNREITKIIAMDSSLRNNENIQAYIHRYKNIEVITEWRTKEEFEKAGISCKFSLISKNKYKMKLDSGRTLKFIKAPFLSSPGDFLIFDMMTKSIISNHLYSSVNGNYDLESILQYHETKLPSSDFVKSVNKWIRKIDLDFILTSNGTVIKKEDIPIVFLEIYKHEFYNTDFVVKNIPLVYRTYDYINILNQYLTRLNTIFEASLIYNTFEDTEFTLSNTKLEITSSTLKRLVMYNRFFEVLFEKNGVLWLNVLEVAVSKTTRKYYIPKPEIYLARSVFLQEKVDVLERDNLRLIDQAESLHKSLDLTREQILRCPLTGLYNKTFFTKFLNLNIENFGGLLLIEVDDFNQINMKYSNEIGDETIRNLHYLLQNQLQENVLLFKYDAGFAIYCSGYTEKQILDMSIKFRNSVSTSNLFVEQVSVGIGVVLHTQLPEFPTSEWVLQQATKRVKHAHYLGKGEIVHTEIQSKMFKEGSLLLVDDDEYNIGSIRRICEAENIEMYLCFDVFTAIEIIKTRKIDVIISEINLSKLDAFQLKTEINKFILDNKIPFIIASHNKTKNTIIRANSLDIDYILNKPFYPEELLGLLRRILRK